jgi:hypothetical protein
MPPPVFFVVAELVIVGRPMTDQWRKMLAGPAVVGDKMANMPTGVVLTVSFR